MKNVERDLQFKQNKHQFRKSNEDNIGFHDRAKQAKPKKKNHRKGCANGLRASLREHRIQFIACNL